MSSADNIFTSTDGGRAGRLGGPPSTDDPFLSTARVARMFDVKTETVRNWIDAGKIKAVQVNGRWKIRASEVTRYANSMYGS